MTLRPDPHRLKVRHSLVALPFALVLSIRLVVGLGWIGIAIVAATLGSCVAIVLLVRWLRLWHGLVPPEQER